MLCYFVIRCFMSFCDVLFYVMLFCIDMCVLYLASYVFMLFYDELYYFELLYVVLSYVVLYFIYRGCLMPCCNVMLYYILCSGVLFCVVLIDVCSFMLFRVML